MFLSSGTKLGPYEIQSPMGAGGMGEVYRARDSRLNRDVAIKVLPATFASDADRMARFQREAQLLASLNHPNIASIYGLEEKDGARALVMELVEGPTLALRIAAGPIPIEEALPMARQIAEALESAHERGIIHRDLKPANIKLTGDGTVKVLDFGLAKAFDSPDSSSVDAANSPTFTAATMAGVVLGTAAYMSPEQAKGKTVDRRTDIWAFGCVLYEMLTGKQAFSGETITDTLAAILRTEPDLDLLPQNTPPAVRELLQRCLQKDPKERLRDIGDARIELKRVPSQSDTTVGLAPGRSSAAQGKWARIAAWAFAGLALCALAAWLGMKFHAPAHEPVTRFAITMPNFDEFGGITISPDGSAVVFDAWGGGGGISQFYLRRLDQLTSAPVAGTENSDDPSFSPNGKWLSFIKNGSLMKVMPDSGTVQTICPVPRDAGASWVDDGTIIFSERGSGLFRVSAAGGTPELVAPVGPQTGNRDYFLPQVLPGGKFALVTLYTVPNLSPPDIAVVRIDQPGGVPTPQILLHDAALARYAPSGVILFQRGDGLFGAPFDVQRREITGSPTMALNSIKTPPSWHFDVSATGTLVYEPPGLQSGVPVLVDRKGKEQSLDVPVRSYRDPQISPDGKFLAIGVVEQLGQNLWIYDLERHTWMRLGYEQRREMAPVWAPDGRHLFFATNSGAIVSKLMDGSNTEQQIYKADESLIYATSISPDGRTLLAEQIRDKLGYDVLKLQLNNDVEHPHADATALVSSPAMEGRAQFSPDGHWIAYASNEVGDFQVYVQPFPGPGRKWQISTTGGDEPRWSASGREIFYHHGDDMMAVDVKTLPSFSSRPPRLLFTGKYESPGVVQNYAVTRDGQRFVMLKKQANSSSPEIDVVLNWAADLQR